MYRPCSMGTSTLPMLKDQCGNLNERQHTADIPTQDVAVLRRGRSGRCRRPEHARVRVYVLGVVSPARTDRPVKSAVPHDVATILIKPSIASCETPIG